ncbi:MAG TPA: nuclear transport factor 2 family protein [Kofleriaceae bacterium]|nr:nuclear transport factor 2 family protein [Kofleriaceae bacterium]
MGTLIAAYRDMIEDGFHRRRFDRFDQYLTDDYHVVDLARPDRQGGRDGTQAHIEGLLERFRDVRYEIIDAFEVGDKMAVRFVVTGRDADGKRLVSPGMSLHHGRGGLLRRSWHLGDQRDLGVAFDDEPAPELVDRWGGNVLRSGGPLATRYFLAVDRLWGVARPVGDLAHPDYVGWDPFAARGTGASSIDRFHEGLRAQYEQPLYEVLDTFEVKDWLATRFMVRGLHHGELATILGLSMNQFREGRLLKGNVFCRYGRLSGVAQAVGEALAS